jgi:subtilase family serine protease
MANLRSLSFGVLASAFLLTAASVAQQAAPAARIAGSIDASQLVTLRGNTPPAATLKNDRGLVSASMPMADLVLVLSRSPEQQAAFDAYLQSEYDPGSPNFHQWLAPDAIGERFGPAQADVATVSSWLAGQGFVINEIGKDHMTIRFSGTAGQVESAFHTEIHHLQVNGAAHIGNMTDPQIPAALAPVVVGIKALHDFHPHPLHRMGGIATRDPSTGQWMRTSRSAFAGSKSLFSGTSTATDATPAGLRASGARAQFGISVPASGGNSAYRVEDVAPYDFATIYNVLPLWNASIDGAGETIAIAGTSDIQPGDVAAFRSTFGLPAGLTPVQLKGVNGTDPGVCTDPGTESNPPPCTISDLYENTLDVEWSGAVAKGAQIKLVTSGYNSGATNDPIYDSSKYVVDNVTAKILSLSYGLCELGEGTAGNVAYYDLWQAAAAAGISVFVASGDAGSPACDQGGDAGGVPYLAEFGLSVNGIASTPYDTAVGGTDFNWCSLTSASECTAAPYWNSTNAATTQASAAGYVPEVPWNDTCASSVALPFLESFFSQVVTVPDTETACNAIVDYATDLQQQGYGVILNFVDTAGTGGGASNCVANDSSTTESCSSSTTSTGSSDGSIALYHDGWPKPSWQSTTLTGMPDDGVRDIPDVSFFASDGFLSSSAYLICVTDAAEGLSCNYSATAEPQGEEVGGTSVATPAMAGVQALIDQKWGNQGLPNSALYAIAAKQNYSNCKAESATVGNGCYFNDVDTSTNAMACDNGAGGYQSPNCTVIHSGDEVGILSGYSSQSGFDLATGLGSLNVANVVNASGVWNQSGTTAATVTVTPASGTINSNQSLAVAIKVTGGSGTPTGMVTLASGSYTSAAATLASGSASITIPASTFTSSGTVTLTATYRGDTTYASSTGTASVTVTLMQLLTPTVTVTPASNSIDSDQSLSVTVALTGAGATPTGTVSLAGGGYSSTAETLASGSASITIPANTFTTFGSVTLTATYTGDTVYAAGTNTATVTVNESAYALTGPTAPTTISSPGGSATASVSVAAANGYAGTVALACTLTSSAGVQFAPTCAPTTSGSSSVTLSSGTTSGSVSFTVSTTAATAELVYPKPANRRGWMGAGGGAVLAFLVFLGIPARRRSWRSLLGILVLTAALGSLSACGGGGGGGGGGTTGTPTGTYTFSVAGTGSPTVSPAPAAITFSVTVN